MLLTKPTKIAKATLALSTLLARVQRWARPIYKKSHVKALPRVRLLDYTIRQATSYGHIISSRPKDMQILPILFIKTTWALCCLPKMVTGWVPSAPNISNQNISSFAIITTLTSWIFNIVPPNRCGLMFWLNHSKDLNSNQCMHSSWIALLTILKSLPSFRLQIQRWLQKSLQNQLHFQKSLPSSTPSLTPMKPQISMITPSL